MARFLSQRVRDNIVLAVFVILLLVFLWWAMGHPTPVKVEPAPATSAVAPWDWFPFRLDWSAPWYWVPLETDRRRTITVC